MSKIEKVFLSFKCRPDIEVLIARNWNEKLDIYLNIIY